MKVLIQPQSSSELAGSADQGAIDPAPVPQNPMTQITVTKKPRNKNTARKMQGRVTTRNGRNLRNGKAKATTINWKAYDKKTDKSWEFRENTTFAQFSSTIGSTTTDIWWYQGFKMCQEAALSTEEEFDRLLQVVLSGLEHGHDKIDIWKSSEDDFNSP
jgi:hypothetical protein